MALRSLLGVELSLGKVPHPGGVLLLVPTTLMAIPAATTTTAAAAAARGDDAAFPRSMEELETSGWMSPMRDERARRPYTNAGRTPEVRAMLAAFGFDLAAGTGGTPTTCFERYVRSLKATPDRLMSVAALAAKIRGSSGYRDFGHKDYEGFSDAGAVPRRAAAWAARRAG